MCFPILKGSSNKKPAAKKLTDLRNNAAEELETEQHAKATIKMRERFASVNDSYKEFSEG